MKAISLWQPWASAMAIGSKRIETRSWATSYRGPLVIHAAKKVNRHILRDCESRINWQAALSPFLDQGKLLCDVLPFGALVAVGMLIDCQQTDNLPFGELKKFRQPDSIKEIWFDWCEYQMGDFSSGRFGWIFENMKRLDPPIPYRGRQRLFDIPNDVLLST